MKPSALHTRRVRGRVLVIDDEAAMGAILTKSLALDGFETRAVTDPLVALRAIASEQPDVILTDFRMPGLSGGELLDRVKRDFPDIPVLIMTAYGTIEDAVTALKAGAFNYITKPFQHETLVHQIELALERRSLELQNSSLAERPLAELDARRIIGSSPGLAKVREMIERAAGADSAVLITGESGVGKELVAREIHRRSERHARRFITVNCPAIPPTLIESELFGHERGAFTGADRVKMGLIELSAGGSLFLDEIAEIPAELQVKLLRVLQEHEIQRVGGLKQIPVDLRVIAATNRDLEREIDAGRFRPDLFYRINVVPIQVPPLRDRPGDVPELVSYFLERFARSLNRPGLHASLPLVRRLQSYPWPGNARQLENALERMAVLSTGEALDETHFPADLVSSRGSLRATFDEDATEPNLPRLWPFDYKDARDRFEREYVKQVLSAAEGKVAEAAKLAGISRRNFYEKIEKLGVPKEKLS